MSIPNLREKKVRDQYRQDTACTDPKTAGSMLLPTTSAGTPEIEKAIYNIVREKWLENEKKRSNITG